MRTVTTLLTAAAMTAMTALPAQAPAQTQTGVECAGIGEEGRAMVETIPHTLKLVYAQPDGSYLGAVTTRISRGGEVLVDVTCPGPWVMANLPAGTYEVAATFRGQTKTVRVSVPGSGSTRQIVTF